MLRRERLLFAAAVALFTLGACQGYNFNPVGHCLIQPGTKRITLSTMSTADVLFVVDDSGSMAGEQTALANAFGQFTTVLESANVERVANGLDPIDFHIAVTTTSNFINWQPTSGSTCSANCPGASGKVCCLGSGAVQPVQCKVDGDCAAGYTCKSGTGSTNIWPTGGPYTGCFDSLGVAQPIPCTTVGNDCGVDSRFYQTGGCTLPYGKTVPDMFTASGEFPMGRFFSDPANASSTTPEARGKVLHFNKNFYTPTTNTTAINNLSAAFQKNVSVGTCGSGQEQGLVTAKLAIDRVLGANGGQSTGYVAGEFLHPNSKLVVVWISDENDCSSPNNPAYGVVHTPTGCQQDELLAPAQQREFAPTTFADYFTNLGRPFGAAFITSTKVVGCTDGAVTTDPTCVQCQDLTCYPALCTPAGGCSGFPAGTCGGQVSPPTRYDALAGELRSRGVDVVVGSICDAFGANMGRVAQIVKPPPGLELPTIPAASSVTLLRIIRPDGSTRKTCYGAAPATLDAAGAAAAGYDWWFTATRDQTTAAQKHPTTASRYIYINHATNNCEANFGETYSADYIGQVPAATATSPGGCVTDTDCSDALGGKAGDWTCFGGYDGSNPPKCLATSITARGSCVCGPRADNCPGGSL